MTVIPINYSELSTVNCPLCGGKDFAFLTHRFDGGSLTRCSVCGHVYLNPPLDNAMLSKIYDQYHVKEDLAAWRESLMGWCQDSNAPYQWVLGFLRSRYPCAGRKGLDIGCGPGVFLNELNKLGVAGEGLDMNEKAIAMAKDYYGIKIHQASFEEACRSGLLPADGYDIVCAFEFIEHVRKPVETMTSIRRILKPGGIGFMSTPNMNSYKTLGKAARPLNNWQEHLQFFYPETLRIALEKAGLECLEVLTTKSLTPEERLRAGWQQKKGFAQVWRLIKKVPFIAKGKDWLFRSLAKEKTSQPAQEILDGDSIVAVFRKTA